MEVRTVKNLGIPVEDELHKQIKIRATELDKTIRDYILDLVKEDLRQIDEKQK